MFSWQEYHSDTVNWGYGENYKGGPFNNNVWATLLIIGGGKGVGGGCVGGGGVIGDVFLSIGGGA